MVQTSTLPDDDLAGNADDSRNLGQQAYNDEVGAKPLDEDERAKLAEIEQNYGNSGGSDEGAPESLENATPEQQREAIAEQEEAGDEESLYSASEETTSAAGGKGKESFGAKLLAGSKRFGPSGGIIGLLVGGAGFSSVLLAPGSLLVALEKAVTNDSSDSTRTNIVFRRAYVAKQFSKDKSRGTTKLESDLTSVSADEAARYTQDGYKINLSPEGTIDSLEFPDHHTVTDGAEYTDYAENTTEGRRATSNVLDVRSAFFENQAFKDTLGRYEIVKGDRLTPSDDPDPAKRKEAIDKSFDENTKLNETPGDASDPKVIDVREKALTSDTIGDDSGTKLKPQVDRITGDIAAKAGAAALVTAPVSVGCAVYNVAKLTNATIKAKWVYDLISFAYPFVRAAAQIEDQGNIEPSVVEDLANRLTTPDSGGKTAMDSQALQMAIYGDFTGLTDMAKKYTSWGWEQQVDSAASLIVNNVRDVFGKDGIKDICRGASYVQAGGIIACVNDPVAAVFCAAGAVLAPIAEHFLLPVLVAQLAKPALHYLATVDLSSALNGEGLGDAIGVGIGWLLSNSTLGAGMVVAGGAGGLDAVKNFISKTDTPYFNTTTQLAIDQAKGDPWNVNNQYSFMGQISSMLNPYPTTDGTLFSKLASMTTVVNTTIANIPGVTAHALFSQPSNMTLQDALGGDAAANRTGKCEDQGMADLHILCDYSGRPIGYTSNNVLNGLSSIVNGTTAQNGDILTKSIDTLTAGGKDKQQIDPDTGAIKPDSEFDNYVKYCTQRTADDGKGIMPIGSSTASITADNYDWTDGSKCAQSNPTMDSYATYYNWCYVQYATSKRVKSCTDKTPEANSAASSTAPTGNIAQEAAAMGGWGGQYQACYTDGGGHGDLADLQRRIAAHFAGPENGVDCSGFTRAVVYQATGTDTGSMSTQDMCADASGPKKFYEKIPQAQAQPGDMAIRCDAHVEVITGVNGGKFSTVGSHTTGCGPGFGPSPGNEQGNGSFVLRFKGGTVSV